ncbi:MAG: carbohydrate ABC transporter permease [Lachnospiraceae bacterium]
MNTGKMSKFDYIFEGLLMLFVGVTAFVCLIPFLHVLAKSISDSDAVNAGLVMLIPVGFSLDGYKSILNDSLTMASMAFSIYLTLLKVLLSLTFTACLAYPLSRKSYKWRRWVTILILFTMYFSGGTIPSYLLVMNLGLLDSVWALIIPSMLSVYNIIVMRSFFSNISDSLIESVKIDGGSEVRAFFSIVLPLSKPVMATIALFYGVSRWNSYSDVVYYIRSTNLYTLQMRLQQIVQQNQFAYENEEVLSGVAYANTEVLKCAVLVFATVPILVMYPFLQKYFVKGVSLGSVKE